MASSSGPVRAVSASQANVAMPERHALPCGLPDDAGKHPRLDRADLRKGKPCHIALLSLPDGSSRALKNACRQVVRLLDALVWIAQTWPRADHTGQWSPLYPTCYGDAAARPAVCRDHHNQTSPDLNRFPLRLQASLTPMRRTGATDLLILPLACVALCQPS